MGNRQRMLIGIAVGATLGGAIGAMAGVFTDADLAISEGFLYRWVPVIFVGSTLLIIVNGISLDSVSLKEGRGWLLLILAGVILGALEGVIGGVLLRASPERTVWMWIKGDWGASLGMLLVTAAIAIYKRFESSV